MPTDKQAKQAQIGAANLATRIADEKWQLVVDGLNQRIKQLEEANDYLAEAAYKWEQNAKRFANRLDQALVDGEIGELGL